MSEKLDSVNLIQSFNHLRYSALAAKAGFEPTYLVKNNCIIKTKLILMSKVINVRAPK